MWQLHPLKAGVMQEAYVDSCTAIHASGLIIMLTRDTGHHSSGLWKNPDYERCLHLSLSFRDPATGKPRPRDKAASAIWVRAIFGNLERLVWTEPPVSERGKANDVWHYRVFFADEKFTAPILPRGEVYSKELTEAGWQSWSDQRAAEGRPGARMENIDEFNALCETPE